MVNFWSKGKQSLVSTFTNLNVNYCLSVWNFTSKKILKIVEEIQKRYLKLLLYDQTNKQTKKKTQKASQLRSKKLIILAIKKNLEWVKP